jgi:hypothetical protein
VQGGIRRIGSAATYFDGLPEPFFFAGCRGSTLNDSEDISAPVVNFGGRLAGVELHRAEPAGFFIANDRGFMDAAEHAAHLLPAIQKLIIVERSHTLMAREISGR